MMEFSIITITTFVTMLNELVKRFGTAFLKKDLKNYIPLCSMIFGIILGITGFFLPGVDMGDNIVEAIFIGLAAGSAATGVDQVPKQLKKLKLENLINVDSLLPDMTVSDLIDSLEITSDEETTEEVDDETVIDDTPESMDSEE